MNQAAAHSASRKELQGAAKWKSFVDRRAGKGVYNKEWIVSDKVSLGRRVSHENDLTGADQVVPDGLVKGHILGVAETAVRSWFAVGDK